MSDIDELPLWSAPFGLVLLDTIRLSQGMKVLDIGSGSGFPMLEIADRLGLPGHVTGIDPSDEFCRKITEKVTEREIPNATIIKGVAEQLPFGNDQFDLITSNNGLNNVQDQPLAFLECYRTGKPGAQLVITMNLPHTMIEFYEIFEEVLRQEGMNTEVGLMRQHIAEKRKSVDHLKNLINETGFNIRSIQVEGFKFQFATAMAFFSHHLIKNYFLPHWEAILPENRISSVMFDVRERIDRQIDKEGSFTLSVPYACFDCLKPATTA